MTRTARLPWRRLVLAVSLAGLGCASHCRSTPEQAGPPARGHEELVKSDPNEKLLRGSLARTVEAGGWILESDAGDYLLLSTSSYRKEIWFREGKRVEVRGKEAPDAVTIYMQGTPFRVTSMAPLGQADQQQR